MSHRDGLLVSISLIDANKYAFNDPFCQRSISFGAYLVRSHLMIGS